MDIIGIFREVSGEVPEEKVFNIFDKIGYSISPDHIESCHRINKKKMIPLLLSFLDERTAKKFGRSDRSAEIENGRL